MYLSASTLFTLSLHLLHATSATAAASAEPVYRGFNYDAADQTYDTFTASFKTARDLVGTEGAFTSARLFTTIQAGTTNDPISAIPAAIATNTSLLLGLFYPNVDNELAALSRAIVAYGDDLAKLVVGISVGSEDLYRNSPTGIAAKSNPGANPIDIINFVAATRTVISDTLLKDKLVGHVDTWTAYVNASNADVIAALDFVGMDAYPYFQFQQANSIDDAAALFEDAHKQTVAVAQGKPVWVTETGWPVGGKVSGAAVTGAENAQRYYRDVGCGQLFGQNNTWWYILHDSPTDDPTFRVTDGTATPLYDLSCPA